MKKIIIFLWMLFLSSGVFAQVNLSQNVVYLNNNETIEVGAGVPIILTNKDAPKEVFTPEKVNWRPQLPMVEVAGFKGERFQVPLVTHIPMMTIFIQVFSDKSAIVTERIVLVNTTRLPAFNKSYPLAIFDQNGKKIEPDFKFLFASLNGKEESVKQIDTLDKRQLIMFADVGLSKGVNLIELSYEISNAVAVEGNISRLFLPFIGAENPYILERGSIILTYPYSAKIFNAKAFYGLNNQTSDAAGRFYEDQKGHLVYKMQGLLPAGIDFRLEVVGNASGFSENQSEGFFSDLRFLWVIILIVLCFVLSVYLFFAALDLKDQLLNNSFINKIRPRLKYDISLFRPLIMKRTDAIAFFVCVLNLMQKQAIKVDHSTMTLKRTSVKISGFDKKILKFIFPRFKRKRALESLKWNKKGYKIFRKIIQKRIRKQMMKFMLREFFICILMCAFSLGLLVYFDALWWQLLLSAVILVIFLRWQIAIFQKRAHLKEKMCELFEDYSEVLQNKSRESLINVALDRKEDSEANIELDKNIALPIDKFKMLFIEQLTVREKKNE